VQAPQGYGQVSQDPFAWRKYPVLQPVQSTFEFDWQDRHRSFVQFGSLVHFPFPSRLNPSLQEVQFDGMSEQVLQVKSQTKHSFFYEL
jgi:hypothetical protein